MEDTTFVVFLPEDSSVGELPVVLFQSGWGCNSESHRSLLQKVSNAGFLVVSPDREGDQAGGPEGIAQAFQGNPSAAAVSANGMHLVAAYDFIKDHERADISKLAVGGMNMGGCEAINATAILREQVKACFVLSGAMGETMAQIFGANREEMKEKVAGRTACPSLWITAESDCCKPATTEFFELCACPKGIVTINDSCLDLELPNTLKTTIFPKEMLLGDKAFPGLAEHCALGCETKDVSNVIISAFLKDVLNQRGFTAKAADDIGEARFIGWIGH